MNKEMEAKGFKGATGLFYILVAAGVFVCALTVLENRYPLIQAICGGPSGGCAEVSRSKYATVFGVQVGLLGIYAYLCWAFFYWYMREIAGLFGAVMLGAELHFMYALFFVLETVCPLCIAQFLIVLALNVLLFFNAYPAARRNIYRGVMIPAAAVSFAAFFILAKNAAPAVQGDFDTFTGWGNPSSSIVLEVFSDYQCPYCAKFEEVVKQVKSEYPDVYIVFRDFIIKSHKFSPLAVGYADTIAVKQGNEMYLKTRFELFEKQKEIGDYLKERASGPPDDKTRDMVMEKLQKDLQRAASLDIAATPTAVISRDGKVEKVIKGYVPFEKLKEDMDRITGRK